MDSSSTTNDPHTPTYTDITPQLSSASPDTPKKDQAYTPTIIQTPTRMGYNGIGVGVRPHPDPSPSKTPRPAPAIAEVVSQKEEVEGLGYGIDLDEGTIDVSAEMTGDGSSSTSREIVLDTSDLVNLDMTEVAPQEEHTEVEDRDIEFPSMDEMKAFQDRLSGSTEVENTDLVNMVRLPDIIQIVPADEKVKSLLEPCITHLPILRDQLEAQKATIQTLQHQAKLAKQLTDLER